MADTVNIGVHPTHDDIVNMLDVAKSWTNVRVKAETYHILDECGVIINNTYAPPLMKGVVVRINDHMDVGELIFS